MWSEGGVSLTSDKFNEWTDCVMVGHDWRFEGDHPMGEHQLQIWVCSKCNEWDVCESS